jgi:hypothetical protein
VDTRRKQRKLARTGESGPSDAGAYLTREAARQDAFDCIEIFYTPKRKHTNNGLQSPVDFETRQQKLNEASVQETRGTSPYSAPV